MSKESMMKRHETGRSMVEMIGVLAIIGVMSIAGVWGINKALKKNKVNNLSFKVA